MLRVLLELHVLSHDLFGYTQLCRWVCVVQLGRILKMGLCYLTLQNPVPPFTLKVCFCYSFDDLIFFIFILVD